MTRQAKNYREYARLSPWNSKTRAGWIRLAEEAEATAKEAEKMKTYAIKTAEGYYANQGDQFWFQELPNGWAAFCEPEHAERLAEWKLAPAGIAYEIETIEPTP